VADKCLIVKGPVDQLLASNLESAAKEEYDEVISISPEGYELDNHYFSNYIGEVGARIDQEYEGEEIDLMGLSLGGSFAREAVEVFDKEEMVGNVVTWNSPYNVPKFTDFLGGFTGLEMESGTNFMGSLSPDELSTGVNYVNVYSADSPLIIDESNFRLPEHGNVTNRKIGREYLDLTPEKFSDMANVLTQGMQLPFSILGSGIKTILNPKDAQENLSEALDDLNDGLEEVADFLDVEKEEVYAENRLRRLKNQIHSFKHGKTDIIF
jgi:hypothetical protein